MRSKFASKLQILNSFGTIDFDPTYDAKAQRQFKRGDSVGLKKPESKLKRAP